MCLCVSEKKREESSSSVKCTYPAHISSFHFLLYFTNNSDVPQNGSKSARCVLKKNCSRENSRNKNKKKCDCACCCNEKLSLLIPSVWKIRKKRVSKTLMINDWKILRYNKKKEYFVCAVKKAHHQSYLLSCLLGLSGEIFVV